MKCKLLVLILLISLFALLLSGCRSKEINAALIYINYYNNWDKAIEQLKYAISNDSTDTDAHIILGECYGNLGEFKKMNTHFETAIKYANFSDKDSAEVIKLIDYDREEFWHIYFDEGLYNLQNNQMINAEIAFGNCTLIDSTKPEAYINLAIIEEENGNMELAMMHYAKAYSINQKDIDLAFYLSELYADTQNYEKIISLMSSLPKYPKSHIHRGIAYEYLDNWEKALTEYEKAIIHFPDDTDLLFNLGRIYKIHDRYDDALSCFKKVVVKDSTDSQALFYLGDTYLNKGEALVSNIQEADTLSEITHYQIIKQNEVIYKYYKNAVKYLEKSSTLAPGEKRAWERLSMAYERIGFKKKAQKAKKKARRFKKNNYSSE